MPYLGASSTRARSLELGVSFSRKPTLPQNHPPVDLLTDRQLEGLALVSQLKVLTDRMGIDIWELVDAASTKPYGFMRLQPGVGDIRESPALKILTLLSALGAELRYHDTHVPTLPDYGLSSIPLEEALQDADLVLIVTAHPGVDHDTVLKRARLVVDLRGITRGTRVENVVRL